MNRVDVTLDLRDMRRKPPSPGEPEAEFRIDEPETRDLATSRAIADEVARRLYS
jgi:hypothetical protein